MTQNTGFRHLRNTGYFQYDVYNEGGVTIAYEAPKHVADLTNDDKVKVAFAFCSPEDNFSRKVGRDISTARLETAAVEIPGDHFVQLIRTPLSGLVEIIDVGGDLALTVLPGLDEGQQRELIRRLMWCQGYKL